MKTKDFNRVVAGLVFILGGSSVVAFAGQATGNGGETVDLNNRPVLRDLVTHSVCNWDTVAGIGAKNLWFPALVGELKAGNQAFGEAFDFHTRTLSVCLTKGPFKKLPASEMNGITIYPLGTDDAGDATRQVAVRFNDEIYIDSDIYQQMDDRNESALLFHETMHSYLPPNTVERQRKLMTFVNAIVAEAGANPKTPNWSDALDRLMTFNSISRYPVFTGQQTYMCSAFCGGYEPSGVLYGADTLIFGYGLSYEAAYMNLRGKCEARNVLFVGILQSTPNPSLEVATLNNACKVLGDSCNK